MAGNEHSHDDQHKGCLESLIEVFLFIDGQLDKKRAQEIEEHIRNCARCYGKVSFHRVLKEYVRYKNTQETVSPSCLRSVESILKSG
jgi:hypothetical protein